MIPSVAITCEIRMIASVTCSEKWLTNFPEALYKQLVRVLVELKLDEKK